MGGLDGYDACGDQTGYRSSTPKRRDGRVPGGRARKRLADDERPGESKFRR